MTRRLTVDLSESVWSELEARRHRTGQGHSAIIDGALSEAFGLRRHSLFQVSTSNALVQGVFNGGVTVARLKQHGDLGLGTFAGLDGEMVMIDGDCLRATAGGATSVADEDSEVPFALVTPFEPDLVFALGPVEGMTALQEQLDRHRTTDNLLAALRVEGFFPRLNMRAACLARPGEGLLAATEHQSEFVVTGSRGTLVGFWAPDYTRAISIPGYHFHFVSDDRTYGGHVLDLAGGRLRAELQLESELHLAIPETEEFLTADLGGDHSDALEKAETGRTKPEANTPV